MFEDTLMIIKPDYMHKRRPVLLKLLAEEFQIQGSRKLNFSPESAAEFYAECADDKGFMLEVILLSKGTSEAFILTKEQGVQQLLDTMICYFRTASEMERNIHVTKHVSSVAREINFIFPNYIHEPTTFFDRQNFCNRPLLKPLVAEIYNILQNVDCSKENWKTRLAEHLTRTNPALPHVSNQGSLRADAVVEERGQQTAVTYTMPKPDKSKAKSKLYQSTPTDSTVQLSSTSPHSSMLLSTSSCITCGGFERSEPCFAELDLNKRVEPEDMKKICAEEEIIWKEIVVYEEVQPEEEQEPADVALGEDEGGDEHFGDHSDWESNCSIDAPPPSTMQADDMPEVPAVEAPIATLEEEAPDEAAA